MIRHSKEEKLLFQCLSFICDIHRIVCCAQSRAQFSSLFMVIIKSFIIFFGQFLYDSKIVISEIQIQYSRNKIPYQLIWCFFCIVSVTFSSHDFASVIRTTFNSYIIIYNSKEKKGKKI